MSENNKPKPHCSGPVPISDIIPGVLAEIHARARVLRERKRVRHAFRMYVPKTKPEDLIPN